MCKEQNHEQVTVNREEIRVDEQRGTGYSGGIGID
jgi:hypothetical protein